MRVFRIFPPLPTALLLVTGVGIALNFTWLESGETWIQILVWAMAMAASFIAGLLSPRLINGVCVMFIVLVSLSVAFAIYGVSNTDVEPVWFTIMLSLVHGTLAYAVFGVGWVLRGCLLGGYGGVKGEVFVTVDLKRV